ncbi:MAG: hypothetical protein QXI64_10915, partial [Sulfolobales archaeon]
RRNLEDIVRHARWEAEMVKKLGKKWFEIRDRWLIEAWEADRELWKDPRIREAIIKALEIKSRIEYIRDREIEEHEKRRKNMTSTTS